LLPNDPSSLMPNDGRSLLPNERPSLLPSVPPMGHAEATFAAGERAETKPGPTGAPAASVAAVAGVAATPAGSGPSRSAASSGPRSTTAVTGEDAPGVGAPAAQRETWVRGPQARSTAPVALAADPAGGAAPAKRPRAAAPGRGRRGKLGRRATRDAVERVILEHCRQEWRTVDELAARTGRAPATIRSRYLGSLLARGALQPKYPTPTHPDQAYRTREGEPS
jgi:hypothetical protein